VIVNIFLTSFQIVAGLFSGSQGLIADGIHSLSDLSSDFVVLIANKKARKPLIPIITMVTSVSKTVQS
jgi:divalent metal cation (Fe/Co/Zn/Cd) transporter